MDQFWEFMSDYWWVGIILILVIAGIVKKIVWAFVAAARHAQSERTRREIAAYVAEGSMTTDEAERILAAGGTKESIADKICCW